MATVAAAPPSIAASVRKAAARAYATAKAGAASAVGVAGMAAIAVGVGMVSHLGYGIITGGVLGVWLASLLPGGDR